MSPFAEVSAGDHIGHPAAASRAETRVTSAGMAGPLSTSLIRASTIDLVIGSPPAVAGVFARLYDARWPIRQMRLASDFDGDDGRSMAADNTSAYNCRRVAGSASWSDHAFGAGIDINPVENPYLVPGSFRPADGRSYAQLDRSAGSSVPPGVIRAGDVVVRAFAAIGWGRGGAWASPDFQHFAARGR
jgi:poly-gamma-glutamate synthesis protein (capsule biosynthesis protein)